MTPMTVPDFWHNRGRYSKSGMLRALKEQDQENQAEGAAMSPPAMAASPEANQEES